MCARTEQKLSRQTERERELCVHVLGTQDLAGLNKVWRFILGVKQSLKGPAMLLSWQQCASLFLQLQVGPQVKQKIRAALNACQ